MMIDSKQDVEGLNKLSAIFDGEDISADDLKLLSKQDQTHLQNWSLVGASMRNELAPKIDLSFVDKVAAQIENIDIKQEQVTAKSIKQDTQTSAANDETLFKIVPFIKKSSLYLSQLAIAAAVAAVTVIGFQIYNASDATILEPAANNLVNNVSSANLASYQTNPMHDNVIRFNDIQATQSNANNQAINKEELRQKQEQELEKINNYLKGYLLDTAKN